MQHLVSLEQRWFPDPSIQYLKELFLFSCYTGFTFIDVMNLTLHHFEWDTKGVAWCRLYRQKTEGFSPVPILKDAGAFFRAYKNKYTVHEKNKSNYTLIIIQKIIP
jgi:integrase/recombinase XerD